MNKARATRILTLLAAVGAAWWIENAATVEWSYPYCSILDNGEAAAVFGFPLPYQQVFIAGSASFNFIPWLYVFDLAVITFGVFLFFRVLASRLAASKPLVWNVFIGAAAALMLIPAAGLEIFAISIDVSRPVSSFADDIHYSDLRPVAVHVRGRPRNCTLSPFWFPPKN